MILLLLNSGDICAGAGAANVSRQAAESVGRAARTIGFMATPLLQRVETSRRRRPSRASLAGLPCQPWRGPGLDQQLRVDIGHDAQIERPADLLVLAFAAIRPALGEDSLVDEVAELQRGGDI